MVVRFLVRLRTTELRLFPTIFATSITMCFHICGRRKASSKARVLTQFRTALWWR